jgi:hypothetical protein
LCRLRLPLATGHATRFSTFLPSWCFTEAIRCLRQAAHDHLTGEPSRGCARRSGGREPDLIGAVAISARSMSVVTRRGGAHAEQPAERSGAGLTTIIDRATSTMRHRCYEASVGSPPSHGGADIERE